MKLEGDACCTVAAHGEAASLEGLGSRRAGQVHKSGREEVSLAHQLNVPHRAVVGSVQRGECVVPASRGSPAPIVGTHG